MLLQLLNFMTVSSSGNSMHAYSVANLYHLQICALYSLWATCLCSHMPESLASVAGVGAQLEQVRDALAYICNEIVLPFRFSANMPSPVSGIWSAQPRSVGPYPPSVAYIYICRCILCWALGKPYCRNCVYRWSSLVSSFAHNVSVCSCCAMVLSGDTSCTMRSTPLLRSWYLFARMFRANISQGFDVCRTTQRLSLEDIDR